ncbi:MAG: hypothetical protein M0R28_18045 [Pigmentiphaga sp.]|nr:hypothetical protein [Pigmentiphaga sp.]
MEPLQITATLCSPMAVPLYPVALDGLLGAAICERRGLMATVGEFQHVEVPIQRSACGRYHLASVAHYKPLRFEQGWITKRPCVDEFKLFGGGKIRSVNTGTGRNKAYRIPMSMAIVAELRWWAVGDREQIEALLGLVTHIGKRRAAGNGRVAKWAIESFEPWEGFPILRPDGTPTRNLPIDTPELGPETVIGWGPVTYPYWDQTAATEVAQAPDTEWMGPCDS